MTSRLPRFYCPAHPYQIPIPLDCPTCMARVSSETVSPSREEFEGLKKQESREVDLPLPEGMKQDRLF